MKKEDELMKEFLQEELEKESARIKEEVEQDPPLTESGPDPELKNKIWKQAEEIRRQREAYENLSEADKEALRLGKELQLRREEKAREEFSEELAPESLELAAGAEERQPESQSEIQNTQGNQTKKVRVRKRRKKTIVALAVALIAVLGVGITSFGDRGVVIETVDRILGGRKTTNINSESDDTDVTQQEEIVEEEVLQRIKDEFGFDVVRLVYRPTDMKMIDYMLDQEFMTVIIYYQYGENIFTYTMTPAYQDFSFGYDIEDTVIDEYIKTVGDTEIHVTEYLIEASNQQEFSAEFEYNDITYILTGIIEKDEFEKILENLHFF
ncbi:DUF4367 domain-containing protein [Drancourtella massiliensis]|uniref:DUF4367 domain-containing protein n=1 Tax=Drancourtella massiliensis TaxID=1632013 RepID=A0ABS2EIN6_9FIRM|nr:DUF4367 domain-containing protein [Drancourtella massiliensis]MBM6744782.1 DUF4367 domain-containing protein [Drancourtella massiliensis]